MDVRNSRSRFTLVLLTAILAAAEQASATMVIQSGSIASVGADFTTGTLGLPPTNSFSLNVFYDYRDLTTTSSGGPLNSGGWASIFWNVSTGSNLHISASGSSTEGYNGVYTGPAGWLYGRGHADFSITFTLDRTYSYSSSVLGNVSGIANGQGLLQAGVYTISGHTLGKMGGFSGVSSDTFSINILLTPGQPPCEVPDEDRSRLPFPTRELPCPSESCLRREALPGTRFDGPSGLPCLVDETIQDARGVSFEVWCADWVAPTCDKCFGFFEKEGGRTLAGKCWFDGGDNMVSIEYSTQDVQEDGTPECFISSRWDNFQVNREEPDPPLPDQPPGPLSGGRYPPDGKLDTWTYVYHVPTAKIDVSVSKDLVEVFHQDPTSGLGFNDLPPVLGDLPDGGLTKRVLSAQKALCDLNRDGRCDGVDFLFFRRVLGSCRGSSFYSILADANLDGCITLGDERVLFLAIPVTIEITPGSFPNSINPKGKGKIPVAVLSTQAFNAPAEVDTTSLTFGRTGDELSLAFCNASGEDVNADGLLDLVCHFETQLTGFQNGDTQGAVKGRTVDGTLLRGADSVRLVP